MSCYLSLETPEEVVQVGLLLGCSVTHLLEDLSGCDASGLQEAQC